jgi:flagellar motor switch protein FliM
MAVSESSRPGKEPKARKPARVKKAAEPVASPAEDGEDGPAGAIRALDFSQPTKFTTEIRHRIAAAFEPFCEALSASLTSELRREASVSIAEVAQQTWAGAKAQLPADSLAVAVEEPEIARHMLLSVELPFLLQALECMLGGEASQAPAQRHLSEIDWALVKGLLDTTVAELSPAWVELGGPALARGEVDLEGDAGVVVPVAEPTLTIALASAVEGRPSQLTLLIPWAAVAPIAERIKASGTHPHGAGAPVDDALRHGLAGAQVLLRAEVGSLQMPIERMLEIGPGSLVALEGRAEDGVRLFAEGVSLGRGRPGRSGTRRAIKLESTDSSPVRSRAYATLGRSELERARAEAAPDGSQDAGGAILRSIFVRVWAELGRTHRSLGDALELAPGAVVELDQDAQAPVELFANGLCFAAGSLVVTSAGGWGVQVERIV